MDTSTEAVQFFMDRANRTVPKRLRRRSVSTLEETAALVKNHGKGGNAYRHTKTGYRADLGILTRSGWEANVCRILKSLDIPYEFEPTVFYFPIKRGTVAYRPDILLTETDEWIEIKGYFDNASRIKLKRFKKYFPDEFASLTMIIGRSKNSIEICKKLEVPRVLFYEEISNHFKPKITTWEGR